MGATGTGRVLGVYSPNLKWAAFRAPSKARRSCKNLRGRISRRFGSAFQPVARSNCTMEDLFPVRRITLFKNRLAHFRREDLRSV